MDKIKRNSIFSAILLTALGIIILICPEVYIPIMTLVFGYTLVIVAIVIILDFFTSRKSLMDYAKFVGALVLLIVGICVLVFRSDVLKVLSNLFGFLLILDGGRTLYHSLTFSRRSNRKGWWVLTILSAVLMIIGIILFVNPWWNDTTKIMKVIGCTVLFSAVISGIRLYWTWPLKKSKGGDDNGEA